MLKKFGDIEGIVYWAYCFMEDHVHLVALPKYVDSLSKGLGIVHWKYSLKINLREGWKGYLWQGRFFSCPLESAYLYRAIRYIELSPVRAGIAAKPEDYPWSSARAHIQNKPDLLVAKNPLAEGIRDWASFLAEGTPESEARVIKSYSASGRPLGNEAFVCTLEIITGRVLRPRKRGRKPLKSEVAQAE